MLIDLFMYNMPFEMKVILFFTFVAAIVIGFTLHEFAHAFAAHKCGDPTAKQAGRVTLNPLAHIDPMGFACFAILGFGWAKPVPVNTFNFKKVKRDTFIVSVAGILTNIAVAFIVIPFLLLISNPSANIFLTILYCLLSFIVDINIVLFVFNLIPIYPLDGFNALSAYMKYDNKFVQWMYKNGYMLFIGFLIIVNLIYSITGFSLISQLASWVEWPLFAFWGLFF